MSARGRPRLFLGCSSDARAIAKFVVKRFRDVADVNPWWGADVFRPMRSTLSALIDACRDHYDFGLFLLTPDDKIVSRGKASHAPRDNVWFEFGLFIGGLGVERTFALHIPSPRKDVKKASDLDGIGIGSFRTGDQEAFKSGKAGPAIKRIRAEIKRYGRNHGAFTLAREWNLETDPFRLRFKLERLPMERHASRLLDQQIVLVAYVDDPQVDAWNAERIFKSEVRLLEHPLPNEIELCARLPNRLTRKQVKIFGRLFLVPPDVQVERLKTMRQIAAHGGLGLDLHGQSTK